MQLGMVGLGRMGGNILRRVMRAGHEGLAFDRDDAAVATLVAEGATGASSLAELVSLLHAPRIIWVMLPAGEITEACLRELHALLSPGDVIIEGGNSFWKDSARRGAEAKALGLHYLDIGTSGGVWGLKRGYCLMIGGAAEVVARLDPLLAALVPGEGSALPTEGREARDPRPAKGYVHCGPNGAGHYAKMVHNGIEYGMMQAMAEGLDLMRAAPFPLDLPDITEAWRRGSVVSSWLLDLTAQALAFDPDLAEYSGHVSDSGEGRWTVDTAVEQAVPVPVLAAALFARFRSRQEASFADKALSAMRKGFGGHLEPRPQAPRKGQPG
ncbi:phosphogluconate dehydrogenase (NAD(+)-dependent, decarboxylating) [Sediminicoccus sp. KRV36]|uniref:phosphogluconate dehydrogenase (NAD(+)-dependent, decarboxylating) n=1 Tax=Sediminicoccus sp. KRV36 TaxID=3133721 RepID=UPI00200F89CB|nr:decarboxylating 6-phosphogluconate dehydrogenase [Sediminicoccus rosea]UPY37142.1 decarboxylating 6-phosphogluconate dehydrogenase [Sediminicoccus rosea]